MTLEEFFRNERRISRHVKADLLYFEALAVIDITKHKYNVIAKTRGMHATNLMENYICWYALSHPNSNNILVTFNNFTIRNIADYLSEILQIDSWEDEGQYRVLNLANGSKIKSYINREVKQPHRVFSGQEIGLLVFDEVSLDMDNMLSILHRIDKLILIGDANLQMYNFWLTDEDEYKIFNKIVLSIRGNYRITPIKCGFDQYRMWADQIRPFELMVRELKEKK